MTENNPTSDLRSPTQNATQLVERIESLIGVYIRRMADLADLTSIAAQGLEAAHHAPQILDIRIRSEKSSGRGIDEGLPMSEADIEQAKSNAERVQKLVKNQKDQGLPFLYEQATVTLWAWTEAAVLDFIAFWLESWPGAQSVDAVRKLKFPLGDWLNLDQSERWRYAAQLLQTERAGPVRQGSKRFDYLLEPFGLNPENTANGRKTMLELSQVRNVLIHRGGLADRRLTELCPWLGLRVGDRVTVGKDTFMQYMVVSMGYLVSIIISVERFLAENEDTGHD